MHTSTSSLACCVHSLPSSWCDHDKLYRRDCANATALRASIVVPVSFGYLALNTGALMTYTHAIACVSQTRTLPIQCIGGLSDGVDDVMMTIHVASTNSNPWCAYLHSLNVYVCVFVCADLPASLDHGVCASFYALEPKTTDAQIIHATYGGPLFHFSSAFAARPYRSTPATTLLIRPERSITHTHTHDIFTRSAVGANVDFTWLTVCVHVNVCRISCNQ